ncbi:mechanosensitive ion channel family protein [Williamsia sp. MIQD14]|uniref:mechanosensitive ion channel family protein n=1 Tax=Williamsia sp. MIQD14 TaxID=3425703 RepID=UPI003DA1B68E
MTSSALAFEWTETNRMWLLENPIRITAYIVAGLVTRWLMHRLIDRATRRPLRRDGAPTAPTLVRHLRERAPQALRDPELIERRAQRAETIGSVAKSCASIVLLLWVVLSGLSVLHVNIAPFLASAGIVGLAIGFGAQNLVRDFVSGAFMLLEDQYGVGDIVDLGEASGTVESVGLRVTTIRDIDGTLWYVRNGEIIRVGNMSQDYAVARVEIPVARTADLDRAQRVGLAAAREAVAGPPAFDAVLDEPQMLGVQDVSAYMVTLRMVITTRPNEQWAVARLVRMKVLEAFETHRIALPTPALACD